MLKNCQNYIHTGFSAFFLWSTLGNCEKRSCLNELKFWEAARKHKKSICWEFQYSNSKNGESPHKSISSFPNRDPFFIFFFWKHYSVCTEKLHNTFFTKKKIFFNFLNPKKWKNSFFRAKIWVEFECKYMKVGNRLLLVILWFTLQVQFGVRMG